MLGRLSHIAAICDSDFSNVGGLRGLMDVLMGLLRGGLFHHGGAGKTALSLHGPFSS